MKILFRLNVLSGAILGVFLIIRGAFFASANFDLKIKSFNGIFMGTESIIYISLGFLLLIKSIGLYYFENKIKMPFAFGINLLIDIIGAIILMHTVNLIASTQSYNLYFFPKQIFIFVNQIFLFFIIKKNHFYDPKALYEEEILDYIQN